jgi:hypothetical protein
MMKKFLTRVVQYFIMVIALLAVTLIYSYYFRYQKSRVPFIKHSVFHKNDKSNDTIGLVLGSSHTFFGIDSKLLNGNVFNFASISQSLMEDYAILKHIKNPVKKVIIPISYFTNWHYLYKTPIAGEKLRAIDYQAIYNMKYPSYLERKDIASFISELTKSLFSSNLENFDNEGNLMGQCNSAGVEISDAKIAFERHRLGKDFGQIHPYLDSINMYCAENKIELYLIAMPYTREYRTYTSKGGFDKYLKRVTAKYNSNHCVVLDFRTHFQNAEEQPMFRDADHLSFCGRSAFSKFLNDQMRITASKSN